MPIPTIYLVCDMLVSTRDQVAAGGWRYALGVVFSALAIIFAGLAVRRQRNRNRKNS